MKWLRAAIDNEIINPGYRNSPEGDRQISERSKDVSGKTYEQLLAKIEKWEELKKSV